MGVLTIRNVDDDVIARLKVRAKRNHRSLEGELRHILGRHAQFFAASDQPGPITYLGVMVRDVSGPGRRAWAILRRDTAACASAAGRSRGWRGGGGPVTKVA